MSNYDNMRWCEYLGIPINNVFSRDEKKKYIFHKQALFIYNLEPCYMSGSHWVAKYVKKFRHELLSLIVLECPLFRN